MEDRPHATLDMPIVYRCPGEAHPIDRAVHLARLAEFYPPCLECAHRHDTQGLSSRQLRARAEVERRATAGAHWQTESLVGTQAGDITLDVVENLSRAVAALAWERIGESSRPTVLVGSDGTWATADFVPAACRALQLAGCQAMEIGAVTSPALSVAAASSRATAAIWIGGFDGASGAVEVRVWQADGRPASSPGALDAVRQLDETRPPRSRRGGGTLGRLAADALYLPKLASAYHGLRPLVFVLDTNCEVLVRYWKSLAAQAACRATRPLQGTAPAEASDRPPMERRLERVSREVTRDGAHFGVWIDAAGEACRFVDDKGRQVPPARLAAWLGRSLWDSVPNAAAGEREISTQPTAEVVPAAATREQMAEQMQRSCARLAGDAAGHIWFRGTSVPDALATLSLVLSLLSHSDRPFSEVLDAAPSSD